MTPYVTALPYVITFDEEADGGPFHFLATLISFYVKILNNGIILAEGIVSEVTEDIVTIIDETTGDAFSFNYWTEIDEVRYC